MIRRHCNRFFSETITPENYVLLVLNGSLGLSQCFHHLWINAAIKICADGGANYLYDMKCSTTGESVRDIYTPDYIQGDFDSVRDEVLQHYRLNGSVCTKIECQDTNDSEKCLLLASELQTKLLRLNSITTPFNVIILGGMGGRFDQEMQNINSLFRWGNYFNRMIIMSNDTLVTALEAGSHEITPNFAVESRTCGLIPVGNEAIVTTKGLRWNLTNTSTSFGDLISSSNHVLGESVTIKTSSTIIWTTSLL